MKRYSIGFHGEDDEPNCLTFWADASVDVEKYRHYPSGWTFDGEFLVCKSFPENETVVSPKNVRGAENAGEDVPIFGRLMELVRPKTFANL